MKSPLTSKTIWVNMIVLCAGVAGYVAGHDVLVDYPQVIAILTAVVGGLNIALRFITTKPIG